MGMSGAEQLVHFPVEAEVPESKRHLQLRTLLFQFLELAFAKEAAIGCDQFVYWDPTEPRVCLAPGAFRAGGRSVPDLESLGTGCAPSCGGDHQHLRQQRV